MKWKLVPEEDPTEEMIAAALDASEGLRYSHDVVATYRAMIGIAPQPERDLMSEPLFYLQDSRGYVGNDVLWWAKDGKGYTTDLSKAHVYTESDVVKRHDKRSTDILWPKEYIDAKARPTVDMQHIDHKEGMYLCKKTYI